ncbi:MAG TPA: DinB family protein [Cyclobacteriaceae bacterium]|nr:DinB family protein [Cyclobacteriaceae bacterium]
MKEYFLQLYRYNAWSNDRVINCLLQQNVSHEKILTLMGHVVAAQFIWLHRIKGLPPPSLKLWDTYNLADLAKLASDAGKQWIEFVESTDNFNRELSYKNYVGDPYVNNVESIMIHLVNHSTYHRGQVALLLRENGLEPVNTDFITYDRVMRGQWKE